jgi:membrane fusion protein (multidrug efflux system)
MASKNTVTAVAVVGIALAAAGGWWYQNKPASTASVAAPVAGAPAAGAPAAGAPAAGAPAAPGAAPAGPPRAMGVEVAKVETSPLRDDAQTVGTLKSRQNIMLRPEVAGRVVALGFADGSQVRKGQMLVQLDDSLQRAEIQQAQAQMSIAQANHKRNQDLVSQGFIAQRSLDESQASLQVAQAQVALSCARWERMRIVAPFSGTVGLRTINIGDFVKDGADMVNLEDLTQLYVDFRLPERYQSKLSAKQTVEVLIDAMPGNNYQARIEAIDPLIDANGRSISVRAMLRNDGASEVSAKKGAPALKPLEPAVATPSPVPPDSACQPKPALIADKFTPPGPLRPGMFARVNALFAIKNEALSIPEEAIVPMGEKQFVIKAVAPEAVAGAGPLPPDTKLVSLRTEVKLGTRSPGRVEILSGLTAEDTVVVAGQHRLQKDGTALRVTESRN